LLSPFLFYFYISFLLRGLVVGDVMFDFAAASFGSQARKIYQFILRSGDLCDWAVEFFGMVG